MFYGCPQLDRDPRQLRLMKEARRCELKVGTSHFEGVTAKLHCRHHFLPIGLLTDRQRPQGAERPDAASANMRAADGAKIL